MRICPRRELRRGLRPWLALCLLALLSLGAAAADDAAPAAGTPAEAATSAATAAPADKPKQCYNGCQRWGQLCNADPRGVYRCQRRCEKFGEICE